MERKPWGGGEVGIKMLAYSLRDTAMAEELLKILADEFDHKARGEQWHKV